MFQNTIKVIYTLDIIMAQLEISSLNEHIDGNNHIHFTSSRESGISSSNSDDIICNVEKVKTIEILINFGKLF